MSATTILQKNESAAAYEAKTAYSLFLPRPFLARHPWVGFLTFTVCMAAFGVIVWQVKANGPLVSQDLPLAQAIFAWAKQQPKLLQMFLRFWSAYGRDGEALIAVVLTIGWARKKARRELWMLYFGMMAGELWFQAIGSLVKRPRPEFKDPFETLIGFGFPSGHAVTTVLLGWMILALLLPHIRSGTRRAMLVLAIVLVTLVICFSRLFLGLHYLTDIIAGILFGLGWGGLVYTLIDLYFWRKNPLSKVRDLRQNG